MEASPSCKTLTVNSSSIVVDEHTPLIKTTGSIGDDLGVEIQPRPKLSYWYAVAPLAVTVFTAAGLLPALVVLMNRVLCDRYYDSPNEVDKKDQEISNQNCAIPEIQSLVATAQAIYHFLVYSSTLIVVSYYGYLSDTKGRVFVFRSSLFGGVLMIITFILTARFPHIFGINLIFLGAFARGVFGGDTGLMAAVQAYIADCTSPKERTIAYGRMIASIMCATMLGSNVASFLIKATGDNYSPFYMSAVATVLILAFSGFIPESVHTHMQQSKAEEMSFWDKINISRSVKTLFTIKTHRVNRMALPLIAAISFLSSIIIFPPILLYAMLTLGWSAFQAGLLMSAMAFAKLIMATVILPVFSKFLIGDGQDADRLLKYNIWMARVGCFFVAMEMFAIGLARNDTELFIAVLIGSFSMLNQPSVRSLMTTLVDPTEVGKVLGAIAALDTTALLIAQFGLNTLYSATLAFYPPLTFHLCGFVGLAACACAFFIHPNHNTTEEQRSP